jgi:hypothetical protein
MKLWFWIWDLALTVGPQQGGLPQIAIDRNVKSLLSLPDRHREGAGRLAGSSTELRRHSQTVHYYLGIQGLIARRWTT